MAQEVCQYRGEAYSGNATIRLGDTLLVCNGNNAAWTYVPEDAKVTSANCVFADQEYSQGSILEMSGANIVCAGGRWYKEKE